MPRSLRDIDWTMLALLLFLLVAGVFTIYSASTTKIGNDYITEDFYLRQLIWIGIGLILVYLTLRISYSFFEFFILPGYLVSILLLVLVLFLPEIKGSHRWIALGPFNLQPSELAKITTMLLLSKIISKPNTGDWELLFKSFFVTIIPVVLIMLEPDLGTSLTFWVILFSLLAISDLPIYFLILILSPILSVVTSFFSIFLFIFFLIILIYILYRTRLSLIIIGLGAFFNIIIFFITPLIWNALRGYQQNRILSFIDPTRDPFGAGYQIIQSRIAIGSGGFTGKGFLLGTQKNLNFLPEHHTDFIFSVIGEELGFLGCVVLLLLLFFFLYRIACNLEKLKRKETKLITAGVLAFLTFQIFVNIAINLGIMPTTGIPLPFISYGGSSLLINMFAVGLVLKFVNEQSIFK